MGGSNVFEKILTDENLLEYHRKCRQEIWEQVAGIRERLEAPACRSVAHSIIPEYQP